MSEPIRILIAEDNPDHQFFIVRALRGVEGVTFDIDAVRDGEEVLDFLHRKGRFETQARPHFILMDLKMPKVNGIEVIEHLKKDPELRSIPIAMLTSSDRPEDIKAAYEAGGNTYIVKPPSLTDLKHNLSAVSAYWTETAVLPNPPE